mgnify:CR=1 FL=1
MVNKAGVVDKAQYYIGIMSGTSADGVDLALVDTRVSPPSLIEHHFIPFDASIYNEITALYSPSNNEIDRLSDLGVSLAITYADAVNAFLSYANLTSDNIIAIGNHGQTVRHRPIPSEFNRFPFTVQIGCNQTLATRTNIRVIGDFRTKDIVYGGQGAPLVPAFHRALFPTLNGDCFLVNIGGIANITYLPESSQKSVLGFDTGPGNALLDSWIQLHEKSQFDAQGAWAKQGKVNNKLLSELLSDDYFSMPAPKSTGREYFNLDWLTEKLHNHSIAPIDVQATLTALTARSIADAIITLSSSASIYIVGGGKLNNHLISMLKSELSTHKFCDIEDRELNSNALEAMAFAWLAYAYDKKIYGNIPAVTGASKKLVLGTEFTP